MISTFLTFATSWKRPERPKGRDFFRYVPLTLRENVRFRRKIYALGASSPIWAAKIREACRRDFLFFVAVFLWLEEPRDGDEGDIASQHKVFPWIPWKVQQWWLTEASERFGKENIIAPKCREVGCTWMLLALFLWRFLFFRRQYLALASRVEECVDAADDPDALFQKLDFLVAKLPKWLVGHAGVDYRRNPFRYRNLRNGSAINGYASSANLGRSGRRTAFGSDEFGAYPKGQDERSLESMRSVTNCQIIVSTYSEHPSAFNRIALDPEFPGVRLFVHWWDVPHMAAGMYTNDEAGEVRRLDPSYKYPSDYQFKTNPRRAGKKRSPWYDKKTSGYSEQKAAREYDCDLESASQGGFDRERIRALEKKYTEPPRASWRGRIIYDPETFEPTWIPDQAGPWTLWLKPLELPDGTYVLPGDDEYSEGVDVSAGTGASESCIEVMSRTSGEQVAEFADSHIDPKELARLSIAAGHFFGSNERPAYLVPEVNGLVGRQYIDEVKRIGYSNIHRRKTRQDERSEKVSKKLGWWTPQEGPGAVLQLLIEALGRGERQVRSKKVYDQLCQYVWKDGKIAHPGESGDDESEARASHGDRAVACALASVGVTYRPRTAPAAKKPEPKYGTSDWLDQYFRREDEAAAVADAFNFS